MNKKAALFYIIDALVAAAIIVVTITIIFATKVDDNDSTVAEEAIGNYITVLSNKEIKTMVDSPVTNQLILEKRITNPSSTIFETIVDLNEDGYNENASALMKEVSDIILDPQFSINVSIIKQDGSETSIFEKSARDKNKAKIDLTRQQAISFKSDKFIQKSLETIGVGENGDEACSPAKCLYLTNSSVEPKEFDLKACSANGKTNWIAHCLFETDAKLIGPVIVEVRLWV